MMTLSVLGCATCANSFRGAGGDAAGWSILFLLLVIVAVLVGIGFCMVRLARREQEFLDPELCDEEPVPQQAAMSD
jgi:hypothetical protein